jgi:hypothetical protein
MTIYLHIFLQNSTYTMLQYQRRPPHSHVSLEIGKKLYNEFHIHINDEER